MKQTIDIKIIGMSCQHCVMSVEEELKKLPVIDAQVELGRARVSYDDDLVTREDLISAVEEAGYAVER